MPELPQPFRRLAWTMGGLLAALAPHLVHLQAWITVFVLGICAWRLLAEHRQWRLPGGFVRAVIAIGDDRTDEDMFAAAPADAVTVHVGSGRSLARYEVPDPRAARHLLRLLLE